MAEMVPLEGAPPQSELTKPLCAILPAQDVSESFDPYRHWLGIIDPQRPLNYYLLLGVEPSECNRQKIWALAQRQKDHIFAHVRRIFEELETARDCLCDPQKRQQYDAHLCELATAGLPQPDVAAAEAPVAASVQSALPELESREQAPRSSPARDASEPFDPYRELLGIVSEGPFNHYLLLGLDPYECDRDRIWKQAQCQMDRVLEADPSLQNAAIRRLFNELEAARDCLCNPRTREQYDAQMYEPAAADVSVSIPASEAAVMAQVPCATPGLELVESQPTSLPASDVLEPFDPYREFLGIVDPQWPVSHYILLGLDPGERNVEVIRHVAQLQIDHVLQADPSLQSPRVCHLIEELKAARDCLADPEQRQAYDEQLRREASPRLSQVALPTTEASLPVGSVSVSEPLPASVAPAPLNLDWLDKADLFPAKSVSSELLDSDIELPRDETPLKSPVEAAPLSLEWLDQACRMPLEEDPSELLDSCRELPATKGSAAASVASAPLNLDWLDEACRIPLEEDESRLSASSDRFPIAESVLMTPLQSPSAEQKSAEPAFDRSYVPGVSQALDDYHEWLDIVDPERPLNHYRLLGLTPYEPDLAKIDEVSLRQMARVLERDPTLATETGIRLFGELDAARNCLCDPPQKQAYDAWLRDGQKGQLPAIQTAVSTVQKPSVSAAPRISANSQNVCDERPSSTVAAAANILSRHALSQDAPSPAKPSAPVSWYVRHSRVMLGLLAGIFAVAAFASYPTSLSRPSAKEEQLPALLAKLTHANPRQRIEAAQGLKQLGPEAGVGVPHMVRVLSSETNEDVRLSIVRVLRNFGPAVVPYRRDFEIMKNKEPNPDVRELLNELTKE